MGCRTSLIIGFRINNIESNITHSTTNANVDNSFFAAISATAFAYNGWQAALAFNSEVKNSKKYLPIALMTGFGLVVLIYVLYFIGVVSTSPDGGKLMMQGGGDNFAQGTYNAFINIFGRLAGGFLIGFMIISGLGILNSHCLGMGRAMYSLGRRKVGPIPDRMAMLDSMTNVPNNSMVMAIGISFLWLFVIIINIYWFPSWFGTFNFTLPDFYNFSFFVLLFPIFICFMFKQNDLQWFKRFVAPIMAIVGAGFMFGTYWVGSLVHGLVYFGTFLVLAFIGFIFFIRKKFKDTKF